MRLTAGTARHGTARPVLQHSPVTHGTSHTLPAVAVKINLPKLFAEETSREPPRHVLQPVRGAAGHRLLGAPCPRPGAPKVGCGHPRGDQERQRCTCACAANIHTTSSLGGFTYGFMEGNVNVGNIHSWSRTCAQIGSGPEARCASQTFPAPFVTPPWLFQSFDKPVW